MCVCVCLWTETKSKPINPPKINKRAWPKTGLNIRTLRPCPHLSVFKRKRGCFAPFLKRFASTLIVFVSFSPVHTTTPYLFENAVIPSVRMVKLSRRMRISIYRPAKLARKWSHMVACVCHFGYSTVEWFGAWKCLFWWHHRFQIASFSPSTLENSVFKKHRFQIAPLWRAFSNGSVFGDRFRRCSVDDSRIRSKTAPFSFENGLVWTGPKERADRQFL